MARMRMAVFGDSILWGQGLLDEHKIASGVRAGLQARQGIDVELISFAHSGSDVWDDGETDVDQLNPMPLPLSPLGVIPSKAEREAQLGSPDPLRRRHVGEIPREVPYTLRQVDRAVHELADAPVDLILMDAGINDVNVPHIVLPYMSRQDLDVRTLSVGNRLRILLEHVHASFPAARIVVTGYYAIVSELTEVDRLLRFAARYVREAPETWRRLAKVSAFEAPLNAAAAALERKHEFFGSGLGDVLHDALLEPWKQRMVDLSAIFADRVHDVLLREVAAFNASHGDIARDAIPVIPAEHAILTADPWIWGLDESLQPEDEVVAERKAVVTEENPSPFERFVWNRASVGHPNVRGARAYVDAVMAVLP